MNDVDLIIADSGHNHKAVRNKRRVPQIPYNVRDAGFLCPASAPPPDPLSVPPAHLATVTTRDARTRCRETLKGMPERLGDRRTQPSSLRSRHKLTDPRTMWQLRLSIAFSGHAALKVIKKNCASHGTNKLLRRWQPWWAQRHSRQAWRRG